MIPDEKILPLLQKIAKTLQGNYKSTAECKKDISSCLEDIDKMIIEITGKPFIKRQNVIEAISNGLYGQ